MSSFTFPKIKQIELSVKYQKFCVIVFFHVNGIIKHYSVVCCCKTQEYANKYASEIFNELGKEQPISVHIIPVGYWNSININFKELITNYNQNEANTSLNNFMKNYLDELKNETNVQKQRRESALNKLNDNEKIVTGKYYDPQVGIEKSKLGVTLTTDEDNFNNKLESNSESNSNLNSNVESLLKPSDEVKDVEPSEVEFVNYLKVDKIIEYPITSSKYYVVQFLTINDFPIDCREKYANQKFFGIKIKSFFDDYDDAKTKCEYFNKKDYYFNTTIGDTCEWYPFGFDINTVITSDGIIYQEKPLNEFMEVIHEKEIQDRKNALITSEDENNETLNNEDEERNKNCLLNDANKFIDKDDPEEILLKKLENIKQQQEVVQSSMNDYKSSSLQLNEKIEEIEELFKMLNE